MQGPQGKALPYNALDAVVHAHGLAHGFAAVQHAVPDGVDFALVFDNALLGIGEQGDDQLHGVHMGLELRLADEFFFLVRIRGDFVGQATAPLADAFGQTGAEHAAVVHFQQLVFAGRRARVDDQNFHSSTFLHWSALPGSVHPCLLRHPGREKGNRRQGGLRPLCRRRHLLPVFRSPAYALAAFFSAAACTAVMATVLTISGTVQPRERSLTGLFRPWSTGPMATAPAARCTAL